MSKTSSCYNLTCGHVEPGTVALCPRCGSRTRTSRSIRILGGILLAIGLFLVGLMGAVTINMAPTMLSPGETIDGSTFTGTAEEAKLFLGLFGLVIVFGIAAIVNGLWQLITGRRNRVVLFITLALAALLYAIGYFLYYTLPA